MSNDKSRLSKVELSPKQQRIARGRLIGKTNKQIGEVEYPNATPGSQAVLVSRELKKDRVAQYIEQGKLQTLKEFNVTWRTIVEPRIEALKAEKMNQFTGEINPDHTVRLKAASDLERMLESKTIGEDLKEAIKDLPSNASDIDLVMYMKKRGV